MLEIAEAKSDEERERIFRFRYGIYVEERGKRFRDADHDGHRLEDDWDEGATLLYARDGDQIAGAIRQNRFDRTPVHADLAHALCLDRFYKAYDPSAITMTSRFVIAPAYRHTLAAALLVLETFRRLLAGGGVFDLIHCAPGLIGHYEQLGLRRYCDNFVKIDTGIQIPMVLVARDTDHLRAASSPFLQFVEGAPPDTAAVEFFAREFPEHRRFLNRRTMPDEKFWESLLALAHEPLGARVSLFEGLSEEEIHAFAGSSTVHSFRAGEPIIRASDSGDEMYAVLTGAADVIGVAEDFRYTLRTLGPGDVFGEMALFNRSIRTASVIASTPVTAMVITHGSLKKAVKTAPGVASRLLLNLARTLSQRLDSVTNSLTEAQRSASLS